MAVRIETAQRSNKKEAVPTERVIELRVSANLMTLETGVWCVFPAPGGLSTDSVTGLPGLRITRVPGVAGRPEAVSISTFRDDGWLDNTAALVKVVEGPAQVLITIYQGAGQPVDKAPRLQVMCLSVDPAVAGNAPTSYMATEQEPDVLAHIQGVGDVSGQFGEWIGRRGSGRWIEGFGISDRGPVGGFMEYHGVLGRGWQSPWLDNGRFCGSRGMGLPLLGLNIRLKGETAKDFTVRYSATFVDGSAEGPIDDGSPCEAPSLAPLEAFMVELIPKKKRRPASHSGDVGSSPKSPASPVSVSNSPRRSRRG